MSLEQNLRYEFTIAEQLNSPARQAHVADMRGRAYRLCENVATLTSELRGLLDRLEGCAVGVDTRALVGRLRTAEGELEAAAGGLANGLGLVGVASMTQLLRGGIAAPKE